MRILLSVLLALFPTVAFAQPIYLQCKVSSMPDYQQFTSQKQKDAFVTEVFLRGMMGYVAPPSETWVVDLANGNVRSAEDGDRFTVGNLQVTEGKIRGTTTFGDIFDLNRISLKLSYTKFLDERNVTIQGIAVPLSSAWTYQCTAATTPSV